MFCFCAVCRGQDPSRGPDLWFDSRGSRSSVRLLAPALAMAHLGLGCGARTCSIPCIAHTRDDNPCDCCRMRPIGCNAVCRSGPRTPSGTSWSCAAATAPSAGCSPSPRSSPTALLPWYDFAAMLRVCVACRVRVMRWSRRRSAMQCLVLTHPSWSGVRRWA